jgi:uncharacterized protein YndB with AHSA1/START domain
MKILLAIVAVVVLAVLGIVVTASMQPEAYHIERSVVIAAPPAKVYGFIADFNNYGAWSPWESLDPSMKKTVTGAPGTVGSTYAWEGNDKVGAGTMTFTEVKPDERLVIALDFLRPFPSKGVTTWTTAADGAGTKMTWAMDGRNEAIFQKVFGMFFMESMLGKSFDEGLAKLKAATER